MAQPDKGRASGAKKAATAQGAKQPSEAVIAARREEITQTFESAVAAEQVEHLLMLGPDGMVVGVTKGAESSVDYSPAMRAAIERERNAGGNLTINHNHPSGREGNPAAVQLSEGDFRTAMAGNIKEVSSTAVGPDGSLLRMTLTRPDVEVPGLTVKNPDGTIRWRVVGDDEHIALSSGFGWSAGFRAADTVAERMGVPAGPSDRYRQGTGSDTVIHWAMRDRMRRESGMPIRTDQEFRDREVTKAWTRELVNEMGLAYSQMLRQAGLPASSGSVKIVKAAEITT